MRPAKHRLISGGLGLLILIVVFSFTGLVSSDMRWMYVNGSILLFFGAQWTQNARFGPRKAGASKGRTTNSARLSDVDCLALFNS